MNNDNYLFELIFIRLKFKCFAFLTKKRISRERDLIIIEDILLRGFKHDKAEIDTDRFKEKYELKKKREANCTMKFNFKTEIGHLYNDNIYISNCCCLKPSSMQELKHQ